MRVFGTAGVRGVFNKSQTPDDVYRLVQTTTFVLGRGKYSVGWDGRKSSMVLRRAAVSAGVSGGSDVVVFGCVPTPVVAFGTKGDNCLAGFSVTASHNPPEFSGVKFFGSDGMEMPENVERSIERALVVSSWKSNNKFGDIIDGSHIVDEYVDGVLERFGVAKRSLKVVVDCGGGAGGLVTPKILRGAGHDVVPVNAQVSWRFSAREPEPTADNLKDTCNFVKDSGAQFGLAHDGDADRLVLINSTGEVVSDAVLPIIFLKSQNRKGSVVLSENSSSAIAEEAARLGLDVVRARIGKTFVEVKKREAVMASEPSKLVDPSWGVWEDGVYSAAMVCNAIAQNVSLLSLLEKGVGWHYKQVNVPVAVDISNLSSHAEEVFQRFRIEEKREQFGLKLIFRDGSWIMFRVSGTESKTRIYCESRDSTRLEELLQEGIKYVEGVRRV